MKDILAEVLDKINWSHTLKSVIDKGLEKVAISAVAASFFDILTIFGVFFCLFIIQKVI